MRMHRTITGLLALLMIVALPLVSSTSASAITKTRHHLYAHGEEVSPQHFIAKGTVSTYKGRKIVLERKNCTDCTWYVSKKVFTTAAKGKFLTRIDQAKGSSRTCYRVKVPSTKRYKTTRQRIGCIVDV